SLASSLQHSPRHFAGLRRLPSTTGGTLTGRPGRSDVSRDPLTAGTTGGRRALRGRSANSVQSRPRSVTPHRDLRRSYKTPRPAVRPMLRNVRLILPPTGRAVRG